MRLAHVAISLVMLLRGALSACQLAVGHTRAARLANVEAMLLGKVAPPWDHQRRLSRAD